jgi:hypothetical protein
MMTEDDTARILRKWSFEQLMDAYNTPWHLSPDAHIDEYRAYCETLCASAGWTVNQFQSEFDRRMHLRLENQ